MGGDSVSGFTINPAAGSVTEVPASSYVTGSPYPMGPGTAPRSVAVLPTDETAYVLFSGSNSLQAFTLFTGQVAGVFPALPQLFAHFPPPSVYPVGLDPRSVTVGPTGDFVYVTNAGSDNITVFAVSPSSDALVEIAGSPFPVPAGSQPSSLAVDPTGGFAYVANAGSNTISAFAIGAASGALTAVPGSPFATGTQPTWVTVDPSGSFVQVANTGANSVSVFAIDRSTGALTEVHGSPFATGGAPRSIAISGTIH